LDREAEKKNQRALMDRERASRKEKRKKPKEQEDPALASLPPSAR
jgi:hypothetical protein